MPPATLAVRSLVAIVAATIVIGLARGNIVLQKTLVMLTLPAGCVWVASLLLLGYAVRRRLRGLAWFAGGISLGVYLVFCPLMGRTLMFFLEAPYLEVQPLQGPPLETVVVLGGGTSVAANGVSQLTSAGDRVALAARMYHQGLTQRIICTGQRIQGLDRGGKDPAESAREILLDLGIPAKDVQLVGGINTATEMANLSAALPPQTRFGLITSAWHLPRAMRLAKAQGLEPVALPAHFATPMNRQVLVSDFIPDAAAAPRVSLAVREYLASWFGRQ